MAESSIAARNSAEIIAQNATSEISHRPRDWRISAYFCHAIRLGISEIITRKPMLVFSTVCALSLGPWSGVQLFGMTIFDFLDYFTSNILLPVAAVGVCLYVGYGLPKRFFFKEVSNEGTVKFRYAPLFFWFVRIVAPLMILAAFANKLLFE